MNSLGIFCLIAGIAAGAVFAVYTFKRAQEENVTVKMINAEKAKEMIDSGGVIVLDVRTNREFTEGHIEGATLIPHTAINKLVPEMLPDKTQTLLVHCKTGVRSAKAATALVEMGYESVYDFGGIDDWPYETVK